MVIQPLQRIKETSPRTSAGGEQGFPMATEEASIGRGAVLHWPRPAEGDTSAVRTPSSAQQPTGAKEILSSLKRNIFSTLTPLKQHETSQRARNTAGDRENKKPQTAWKTLCHPLDRNTAGTCCEGKQAAAGTTWPHSTDWLQTSHFSTPFSYRVRTAVV